MITQETAKAFAAKWLDSWNSHDIAAILEHYTDDVEFYSPLILLLKFNDAGMISNKADLRKYFEIGVNTYPDLHFSFHHCFAGVNSLVIYYTSVNQRLSAEVFELDENGKAKRVLCNYGMM